MRLRNYEGKCQKCQTETVPCVRLGGSKRCELCNQRNEECSGFSHSQDVKSASQPCNRCGRTISNNSMRDQLRICEGKCSECEKTGVPCIQKSPNSRCNSCDTLGYECANFSHEDHVILNDFKVCYRCENDILWAYFDRHQRNCPGKCDQCTSSSIPCVRTRFGHHKKQGCESCTSKGFECTGSFHADALDMTEKPCRHCGTSLLERRLPWHESRCRGKRRRCRDLDVPCTRLRGGRGKYDRCTQDQEECDRRWFKDKEDD
ncbi:hypothetical protein BGZ61DRAFT_454753 [Ilyonectria robusta]|uniref:uncharacterized protein n=1 Tax=Ilyonectria robusta TaxID=1079257 RepID=UPI001E8CAFB2|nr:uncharacterized protein BGZ61DRAFT_454753 [Ilyonectria robusta]KAH8686610.1 hypothetical protein BGZ61DRAFT_454753 [Ilyonectria robusta]